jgi:hypothetical protein
MIRFGANKMTVKGKSVIDPRVNSFLTAFMFRFLKEMEMYRNGNGR